VFHGGGAVMPACGSNGAKVMFGFGLLAETLNDGNVSGNGLPRKEPFAAVINGVANSGGPGLV